MRKEHHTRKHIRGVWWQKYEYSGTSYTKITDHDCGICCTGGIFWLDVLYISQIWVEKELTYACQYCGREIFGQCPCGREETLQEKKDSENQFHMKLQMKVMEKTWDNPWDAYAWDNQLVVYP